MTAKQYMSVNLSWPEGSREGRDLKPTEQEAIAAAKRLYRFALKRPFKGKFKVTSGRRYTWIRSGVFYVNPDSNGHGWHELVHSISHYCAFKLYPNANSHGMQHAFLEKEMIKYVISQGWLDGKLKRERPEVDPQAVRQQRVTASIKRWESKLSRAENALKKLRRQAAYYNRVMTT